MNNIDELLKKSKPEVPNLPEAFSQKIIIKIKEQNLEIKPAGILQSESKWISLFSGCVFR